MLSLSSQRVDNFISFYVRLLLLQCLYFLLFFGAKNLFTLMHPILLKYFSIVNVGLNLCFIPSFLLLLSSPAA